MADTSRTTKNTRAAHEDAATAERRKAEARMNANMRMLKDLSRMVLSGASLGRTAAAAGLRTAMPMLELYSGTTRKLEGHGRDESGGLEKLGLSPGEAGVVRKALTKATLEAIEISSITHPAYDGAPLYRAYNPDGVMQPPQMAHLLALAAAAAAIWKRWEGNENPPAPDTTPPASQTVAYIAKAPGEYEYIAAPQTASDIRRYAMRQRSLNPPRLAMLAYSGDPGSIVPVGMHMQSAQAPHAARANMQSQPAAAQYRAAASHGHHTGCGCGCGGGSAPSDCCTSDNSRKFPPARYDEDGDCANLFSISCETRWRIRDCFKASFCDFLRCMGDELCEREEHQHINLGKCVEGFVCSFLDCLPDAICPPPEPCEPCCPPRTVDACRCNFAVGE